VWGQRYVDDLVLRDQSTTRHYVLNDLVNVTSIINTSGTVQERYGYNAFGTSRVMNANFVVQSSSSYNWETRFAAYRWDSESGLYQVRYRYYHPLLGTWINRDPIGEVGGFNLYAYVLNSPVNYVDPLGLTVPGMGRGAYPPYNPQQPLYRPPTDPTQVARFLEGGYDYHLFNPLTNPRWLGDPKCNKFVGDCISRCQNRPKPLINGRYPTAAEWQDPNVNIPGYGPPHKNPKPGDVVTDGSHMGFMVDGGYIQAPTYGPVTFLPVGNPKWNPGSGRTPTP